MGIVIGATIGAVIGVMSWWVGTTDLVGEDLLRLVILGVGGAVLGILAAAWIERNV